jgi:hypothetical protein
MDNTVQLDGDTISFSLNPTQAHSLWCVLQNASSWQDTDSPVVDDLRLQHKHILASISARDT